MKVVCINFICSNCSGSYEIFMKKIPQFMTFNCPNCKEFLIIYKGSVQIFDKLLIEKINNSKDEVEIENLCNDLDEKIKLQNRTIITKDEVIDLSIALDKCKSFDDIMSILQ